MFIFVLVFLVSFVLVLRYFNSFILLFLVVKWIGYFFFLLGLDNKEGYVFVKNLYVFKWLLLYVICNVFLLFFDLWLRLIFLDVRNFKKFVLLFFVVCKVVV